LQNADALNKNLAGAAKSSMTSVAVCLAFSDSAAALAAASKVARFPYGFQVIADGATSDICQKTSAADPILQHMQLMKCCRELGMP
jgi:hypothetical protein